MFFHSGFCQCDRIHVFYLHGEEETARKSFVTAVPFCVDSVRAVLQEEGLFSSCYYHGQFWTPALPVCLKQHSHLNLPGALENRHCTLMLFWLLTDPKMHNQRCCYICTAATFATGRSEYAENEWRIAIQRCPAIFSFIEERLIVPSWSWELFLEQGSC